MVGTILFGDDGSSSADLAWMWINAQDWRGWGIDVLTADIDAAIGDSEPRPWTPEQPRTLLNPAAATTVRHLRAAADPRVAIAECRDRDVIVVGPRGRGLMKALHLGSTAQWLMHSPPAPLVIARSGDPVRRAMVCSDGSPDSLAAARALATMPWLPDVKVTVLTVQQAGLDSRLVADTTAELLDGRARSVRLRTVGPSETGVFFHVRDIILSVLRSSGADLVVHGTTGQSRWAGMRAGSIATSLAAHAPCTVLMVHEHPRPGA